MSRLYMICLTTLLLGSVYSIIRKNDPLINFPLDEYTADFVEMNYTNLIEHFPPGPAGNKTFNQRYWVNDKYYNATAGGPIILYLCGEWRCGPSNINSAYN